MSYYHNKVIWLTGASSGIGEALVYALVKEGAQVLASARNAEKLQKVKENCGSQAAQCHVLPLDITDIERIPELVAEVVVKYGRIDLLINNAGVSQRALVSETPLSLDRKIMEVNYFGMIALTKAVLPYMLAAGQGHVAATSSIVGKFGFPLRSAYSASKHALHGFMESLRAETVRQGLLVTVIIPGRVLTNISVNALTKDGQAHGRMDDGQAGGISSEQAAKEILWGMKKGRKEILVGGKELMMVHIRRFLPRLYYRMASRIKAT